MSHQRVMQFDQVGMSYGDGLFRRRRKWVLQDISFDLFRGETLGVVGRNGAGKSTLMKLIAGLIRPDCGRITTEARRVQLLSLQVGFLPELTGRENVILSAMMLGMRQAEVEKRMDAIIEFSGLGTAIDDLMQTYSSGMRARLGFAVGCQADPDILVIDEALGVGDNEFRTRSRNLMIERMQSDRTFVLVSHNEDAILQHCQRALWIEQGRIQLVGEAEAVVAAYRDSKPPVPQTGQSGNAT